MQDMSQIIFSFINFILFLNIASIFIIIITCIFKEHTHSQFYVASSSSKMTWGHFVLLPRVSQLARFPQVWSASHNMHKLITTVISLLILFMWSTKQMLHDVFSSLCTKFQLRGAWVASAPVCLSLLPFVESALVKVGELGEKPTRNDKLNPFLTGARVGRTRMLALWWEFQFRATVHQINFKTCISMLLVHSHKNKDYVIDFWKKSVLEMMDCNVGKLFSTNFAKYWTVYF